MVVQKKKINARRCYIFVEFSCGNERNKSMVTPNFDKMVVHQRKNKLMRIPNLARMIMHKKNNEDPNFWSNGRALKKK